VAGKKKISGANPPLLNASYWKHYSDDLDPGIREKLLFLTMGEISRRGILDVNGGAICEMLNVKPPIINYYFGSFDGLLAEAIAKMYELWVTWTDRSISQKARTPRARLKNFLIGEIERCKYYGTIVIFSSYPTLSENVSRDLQEKFNERMESIFEYTLAVISTLLNDLKTGKMTEISFTPENYPTNSYKLAKTKELMAAASVMWSISGLSLWATGQHGATRRLSGLAGDIAEAAAISAHVNRIVASMEKEFTSK
jgi:AcrR family transcriptional regulator